MFFVYSDSILEKDINIRQIGLSIKKLSTIEKKKIIEEYENIYSKRKIIHQINKLRNAGFIKYKKLREEYEDNGELFNSILDIYKYENIYPVFHRNIDYLVNHVYKVSINDKQLSKFIEIEDYRVFISQFISTCDSNKLQKNNKSVPNIPFELRRNIKKHSNIAYDELLIKYIFNCLNYESYHIFYVKNNLSKYLNLMLDFFNKIPEDQVFRYIEVLELYFLQSRLSENNIINNVLIMESLLIKDESTNIEKNLILKTPLIIRKMNKKYSLNETAGILKFIYRIRSDIVHGNSEKTISDFNTLKQTVTNLEYPTIKSASKMRKKKIIVKFASQLSDEIINMVIKSWFLYPDVLFFIKNN